MEVQGGVVRDREDCKGGSDRNGVKERDEQIGLLGQRNDVGVKEREGEKERVGDRERETIRESMGISH